VCGNVFEIIERNDVVDMSEDIIMLNRNEDENESEEER
jgi:hypothetical protein